MEEDELAAEDPYTAGEESEGGDDDDEDGDGSGAGVVENMDEDLDDIDGLESD